MATAPGGLCSSLHTRTVLASQRPKPCCISVSICPGLLFQNTSPPRVREGDSVLHAAIAASKPRVVEVLLQYGAFPNLEALPPDPTARMVGLSHSRIV